MFTPDQNRQQAVFDRLRQGILAGTLPAGARLPPTRALAEELGVARQTVVLAYERLASEGYVRARTGSGTFVAPDLPDAAPDPRRPAAHRRQPPVPARPAPRRASRSRPHSRDAGLGTLLAGGIPAPDLFPREAWARCAARVLKTLSGDLTGYPPAQGLPELRSQIAAHLAATRGLLADPANIVVTAGTQQALRIAADLLLDPGDAAWVEDPGYIAGRGALLAAGAAPVAGAQRRRGPRRQRRHPASRPTRGSPWWRRRMPRRWAARCRSRRRLALLDWAARANAWVLEDDCDSEFRWSGHPLPPLATLDRAGRVIYCGTFSKTLAPALRLGFAVVPAPLVPAFVRLGTLMDRGIDTLNQAILAEFMRQGLLAPHIRRMRTEYARRRAALLAAMAATRRRSRRSRRRAGCTWSGGCPIGTDEAAAVQAAGRAASRCRRWVPTTPARRAWRGWSWALPAPPRRWRRIPRGGWRQR